MARFPLAAALAAVALWAGADRRGAVLVLACLAAATDIADGWWARRTGTTSASGARLDSWADGALAVALAVALIALVPQDAWTAWVLWSLGALVALRLVVAVVLRRRGQPAIDHTMLNKIAGAVAFVAVLVAIATGNPSTWVTVLALVAAAVAAVAEVRSVHA